MLYRIYDNDEDNKEIKHISALVIKERLPNQPYDQATRRSSLPHKAAQIRYNPKKVRHTKAAISSPSG